MTFWLFLPVVAGLSLALTGGLRRYALARSIMDIPNARSSHSVPTPRGGGVAIVLSFMLALPLLPVTGLADWELVWALLGAGAGIAVLGFLDDHGHIAARWRLLGHFAGAIWALFWLGGFPPLKIFGYSLDLGWAGHLLAAVYLVWILNLYNFMDGIDGIASIEAISVCLGGVLLYALLGESSAAVAPLLLAVAVAGFLYWNFPPARIFMGDAGSGFLGITLGILSLQAAWVAPQLLWSWVILLGVFIVDATFTLLRRLLRGDKVYEAHRSHAYQYASRQFGRHLPVTLAVGAINLFWLLPIALWVGLGGVEPVLGVLIAYLPLVLLAIKFRAGELEKPETRKRTLLVLGAGGHGKAVAEAALLSGEWQQVRFVDDRWPLLSESYGLPVVANIATLAGVAGEADAAIPAVGNNALREQWLSEIRSTGLSVATVTHPLACISPSARIGEGTAVMALAMVGVDVHIGVGAIINANATVDHDASLGDFAHLGVGVQIAGGVQIGSRTWLQAGCCAGYNVVVPDGAIMPPGQILEVNATSESRAGAREHHPSVSLA